MPKSHVWFGLFLLVIGIIMTIFGFFFVERYLKKQKEVNSVELQSVEMSINASFFFVAIGILMFFSGSIFLAYGLVEQ